MSEDSIIYRNTITMEDVDTEVLEKSPAVVKFVKAPDNIVELADDEAMSPYWMWPLPVQSNKKKTDER